MAIRGKFRDITRSSMGIESKDIITFDFPINVLSSKKLNVLVLGFSGKFSPEDHKSFVETKQEYREKVIEEVGIGAALGNIDFIFQSKEDETVINGTEIIYPDGITKDRFFMAINGLLGFYKYAIYTLKKYNISPPKVESFGT